jgi:hypothetical protein
MVRILTKLRVDEISSVDHGAGEGVKIMLMKRDNGEDTPPGAALFNDVMRRQAGQSTTADKLEGMVDAMLVAAPSLDRQVAADFLLHTAHGRRLAEHLNSISKTEKEATMSQVDIIKLHNIDSVTEVAKNVIEDKVALTEHQFTEMLTGHARIAGTTLEKILTGPNNGEIRKAYMLVKGYAPAG